MENLKLCVPVHPEHDYDALMQTSDGANFFSWFIERCFFHDCIIAGNFPEHMTIRDLVNFGNTIGAEYGIDLKEKEHEEEEVR